MFQAGRLGPRIRADGYAAFDRTMHTKDPGKTSTVSVPLHLADGRLAQVSINYFASAMTVAEAVERYLPGLDTLAEVIAGDCARGQAGDAARPAEAAGADPVRLGSRLPVAA